MTTAFELSALAWLLDAALKGLVLFSAVWLFMVLVRRSAAATRSLLLVTALATAACLPLLTPWLPAIDLGWLPTIGGGVDASRSCETATADGGDTSDTAPAAELAHETEVADSPGVSGAHAAVAGPARRATEARLSLLMLSIWVIGTAVVLARLLVGVLRLRGVVRRAPRLRVGPAARISALISAESGARRMPELRESDELDIPITVGWRAPTVILPRSARTWSAARLRTVLLHELAHVARRDAALQWFAHLGCALHWFNPLSWATARRYRLERERACDDFVLQRGVDAADYADALLCVAHAARRQRLARVALAMACRNDLERRVADILDPGRSHGSLRSGSTAAAALICICLLGTLGTLRPWGRSEAASRDAVSLFAHSAAPAPAGGLPSAISRTPDMRRSGFASLLAAAALTSGSFAQDNQSSDQDRPQPARPERRDRGGPGGPGGRGGRGNFDPAQMMQRMVDRMSDELELDDTQRAQVKEIMDKQRADQVASRERYAKLREARENGDTETVAQLEAEIGQQPRRGGPGFDPMGQVADQIKEVLRPDQVTKFDDMRSRFQEGQARFRGRGPGGDDPAGRLARELPDALKLDDAQREEFNALLDSDRASRFEAMRPLFEEMREAREAGDDEKVEELRGKMEAARPNEDESLAKLFRSVSAMLHDDQKPLLADYRKEFDEQRKGEKAMGDDVRGVLRAAKRLRLSDEQTQQLREIERSAQKDARALKHDDKEGQSELASSVRGEIEKILTEDQQKDFEQNLERGNDRGRGGRDGQRGQRRRGGNAGGAEGRAPE